MTVYSNNHYVSHLCLFACLLMHVCRFFQQIFSELLCAMQYARLND